VSSTPCQLSMSDIANAVGDERHRQAGTRSVRVGGVAAPPGCRTQVIGVRAWEADGSAISADAADRIVWISGRSSAAHAALSPAQGALIARAEPYGFEPVTTGFPFRTVEEPWTRAGIVRASARNALQYAALRWHPATARQVGARLEPLLSHTTDRLLAVCGSLGLELLVRGLRVLGMPTCRVRIVALGPVCAAPTDGLDLYVAQAPTDVLSRITYRGPVQLRPRVAHLDYALDPGVGELVVQAAEAPW
jgi:hypothetical protein